MPNWCENKLTIRGTKEALNKFLTECFSVDSCGDMYLDFNKIIPEPLVPQDCDSNYVIKPNEDRHLMFDDDRTWFDWYSWHCDYWGTKWNSSSTYINEDGDDLVVWFNTAWSPCIPIIIELINKYPELYFECAYFEPGCWFAGIISKDDEGNYYDEEIPSSEIKKFSIDQLFMTQEYYDELEEDE